MRPGSSQNFFRMYFWIWRASALGRRHPDVNYNSEEAVAKAMHDVRRDCNDPAFVPDSRTSETPPAARLDGSNWRSSSDSFGTRTSRA